MSRLGAGDAAGWPQTALVGFSLRGAEDHRAGRRIVRGCQHHPAECPKGVPGSELPAQGQPLVLG